MNINQVAKLTDLSPRQIREYEKIGLLPAIARTDSGYRHYSEQNIERLQFIKRAKDVDFSLGEIKILLGLQDNPCRKNSDVKSLTARHIADLTVKIEQLQAMQATLQTWHDSCSGDGSAHCTILAEMANTEN